MKRTLTAIIMCCLFYTAISQNASLNITTSKTTSLIFPFPVKFVDRGSKDILIEQVKEADNILLVKAATPSLAETNLTVITGEDAVYTFKVNYQENPQTLVWQIPAQHEANVSDYANNILDNPAILHGIRNASFDMVASVTGIYIHGETIYYQLQLENCSTIDYDLDYLHFSIRDSKKVKRTATQEIELNPLYIAGNTRMVRANGINTIVVAFPKFTLPDAKFFSIQIGEKNGGRNLSLRMHNRHILKAKLLPELH